MQSPHVCGKNREIQRERDREKRVGERDEKEKGRETDRFESHETVKGSKSRKMHITTPAQSFSKWSYCLHTRS